MFGVKVPSPKPTYQLLDLPGSLGPLLSALDRVDEVTLDTEADNMYHYRTRVCLLQFLVDGETFLVDVLAPGIETKQLWPRLATKHLVMHGSDFDLRLLHAECGFKAKSLFDTMLAAQLLGRKRIGLASLLEEHFGVELDKEGQKANWSKRPISAKLRDYAARDVAHLPDLRDLLTRELAKRDRLEWLDQQCQRQIESGSEGFAPPDENDWRIGRSERLRGKGLTVLHAVWHWREQTAQRLDVPPFKVCSNDVLLRYAHAAEEGAAEAAIVSAAHLGKRHERLSNSLSAAVRSGLERDPQSLPRRRGRDPDHAPLSTEELARQDRYKAVRDKAAASLDIEATLIANRSQLAQIARAPHKIREILLPWQADLLSPDHAA
ncbi:MAG: ribonuclease D [Opitutaceae bacterium]|nr:ribonuclease D [Opitutaceae bacterium]